MELNKNKRVIDKRIKALVWLQKRCIPVDEVSICYVQLISI